LSPLPILGYYDRVWFFPLLIVPLYIASVLIEGTIMSLFRELYSSRRPAWRWALIANAVTYLMISVLLGFWILTLYLTYPDHNEPASSLQP
jgi:amino acid permease